MSLVRSALRWHVIVVRLGNSLEEFHSIHSTCPPSDLIAEPSTKSVLLCRWVIARVVPLCAPPIDILQYDVQVGDSLEEFLVASTEDAKLRQLMMSMSEAIRTIAFKVATACSPSSNLPVVSAAGKRCQWLSVCACVVSASASVLTSLCLLLICKLQHGHKAGICANCCLISYCIVFSWGRISVSSLCTLL